MKYIILLLYVTIVYAQWNDQIISDFSPMIHNGRNMGRLTTFGNKLAYVTYSNWKDGEIKILEDNAGTGNYVDVGYNIIKPHLTADPSTFALDICLLNNGLNEPALFVTSNNDNDGSTKGWVFIYEKNTTSGQYELSFSYGNPNGQTGSFPYRAFCSENHEHVIAIDYPNNIYTFSKSGDNWHTSLDIQNIYFAIGQPTRGAISSDGFSSTICILNNKCKVYSRSSIGSAWIEYTEIVKPSSDYSSFGNSVSINNNNLFVCTSNWNNPVNANGKLTVYTKNPGTATYDIGLELTSDDLPRVDSRICLHENNIQTTEDKIIIKHELGIAIFSYHDNLTASPYKYASSDNNGGGIYTNGKSDIVTLQTIGSTSSPSYRLYRSVLGGIEPSQQPTMSPTAQPTAEPTASPTLPALQKRADVKIDIKSTNPQILRATVAQTRASMLAGGDLKTFSDAPNNDIVFKVEGRESMVLFNFDTLNTSGLLNASAILASMGIPSGVVSFETGNGRRFLQSGGGTPTTVVTVTYDLTETQYQNAAAISDPTFLSNLATQLGVSVSDINVNTALESEVTIKIELWAAPPSSSLPLGTNVIDSIKKIKSELTNVTTSVATALGVPASSITVPVLDICSEITCVAANTQVSTPYTDSSGCITLEGRCLCKDGFWGIDCGGACVCQNNSVTGDPTVCQNGECKCMWPDYGTQCEYIRNCTHVC